MINKDDMFRIGMNLNKIGMIVPDHIHKSIKPWLDEIEEILLKYKDDENESEARTNE